MNPQCNMCDEQLAQTGSVLTEVGSEAQHCGVEWSGSVRGGAVIVKATGSEGGRQLEKGIMGGNPLGQSRFLA